MMNAEAVRIGPGVIRRTPNGPVIGVWCTCPMCGDTNFVTLCEQHARLGSSGLSLTPGFHCACKRHVELHDGKWVVSQ
jgi:hypothetical protein